MRNENTKLTLVCINNACKRFGLKTARRYDALRDFDCPSCSVQMKSVTSSRKLAQDRKAKQELARFNSL